MNRKELSVLNNAIEWASEKGTQRLIYSSWGKSFIDSSGDLLFSVRVSDAEHTFHTLPENFTGDISAFLCAQAQNKLTEERDKLVKEAADLQSRIDGIDCAEAA